MNRVPCRVSDDPFSDYSDDIKGQGVFVAEDVRMQTDRQTDKRPYSYTCTRA